MQETTGLAWRVTDDKQHVAVQKELVPLCELMRRCCSERGMGHVELESHVVVPKRMPAATCPEFA